MSNDDPLDEDLAELLPVRDPQMRALLRPPDIDRLLDQPPGGKLAENFASLRVRIEKAVSRIEEMAAAGIEEARRRGAALRRISLVSAGVGCVALIAAILAREWRLVALLLAGGEAITILVLRRRMQRLAMDVLGAQALGSRFRAPLDAARTPDDLLALTEQIRRVMALVVGDAPPAIDDAPPE